MRAVANHQVHQQNTGVGRGQRCAHVVIADLGFQHGVRPALCVLVVAKVKKNMLGLVTRTRHGGIRGHLQTRIKKHDLSLGAQGAATKQTTHTAALFG